MRSYMRPLLLALLLAAPALAEEPNACVKRYGARASAVELAGGFVCNVRFLDSALMYQEFEAQQDSIDPETDPNGMKLVAKVLKQHKRWCPAGTRPGVFRGIGDQDGSLVCYRNMSRVEMCGNAGINVYDEKLQCLSSKQASR